MSDVDVVVIGAGAAGLAAASVLTTAGFATLVLEARTRVGGRIFTQCAANLPVPIELGAEFVHGRAPATVKLAKELGLPIVDVAGLMYFAHRGRLTPTTDHMERLERVFRRLRRDRDPDRSFAEASAAMGASVSAPDRALARQFVEGFEAADADDISERALAESVQDDDLGGLHTARLLGGYGSLVDEMAGGIRSRVRLGVVVSAVRWRKGQVVVESRAGGGPLDPISARAAIVTIPLGVLLAPPGAAGAIELDPPVRAITRALSSIAMGPVAKVVLRMDDAFWLDEGFARRRRSEALGAASFLLSSSRIPLPTWWTTYPVRSPVLVGWSGGGQSRPLIELAADQLEAQAVESLAHLFSMKPASIRDRVLAMFHHDWVRDPFSRGAYSYPRVGGHRSAARLAVPVERTLWFAGEATTAGALTGTVEGAVVSGHRAARGVARALA